MLGSVGWKIVLSRRKSPWTTVVPASGGMFFGSQAIRLSIASIGSRLRGLVLLAPALDLALDVVAGLAEVLQPDRP